MEDAAGGVSGYIEPAMELRLQVGRAGSEEALAVAVEAAARAPFDLTAAPLVRVHLVEGPGSNGGVLVVVMHHSISDGWSMDAFLRELAAAYGAALAGESPAAALPPLALQYGDYAAWQQEQLQGPEAAAQREWWRAALAGSPALLQLPADRPRPAAPTFEGGNHRFDLGADLMARLAQAASSLGVNLQAVLLAGLQVVLSRYSGQEDVVVGVPTAGRDLPEVQPLIGYFINTVCVRGEVELEGTFSSLVHRASASVVAALERSLLPFSAVVAATGASRAPNVNPIFQVRAAGPRHCCSFCGCSPPILPRTPSASRSRQTMLTLPV